MKELKAYEKACNNLSDKFLKEVYSDNDNDSFWVADKIGEVLAFSDYFVDMNQIADYFRYKYTPDEFFDWYDSANYKDSDRINMRNYKLTK